MNDGTIDTNLDTNGDGKPDTNIDVNGDGVCDFNCLVNGNIVNIVIYTSQTGFTKKYAEWISNKLNGDVLTIQEAKKKKMDF